MGDDTVAGVLTREHREIDAGIEAFLAGLDRGEVDRPALGSAFAALRRHIYIEEEFLFPPVREAGLMMPVMVMLREHAELWQQMARIDALLEDRPVADDATVRRCRELLGQLDQHNMKEEPIIYPHAALDLSEAQLAEVAGLLASGRTPEGWVCAGLRGA